jgi:imidazolonepropionase-like amidohydrolase
MRLALTNCNVIDCVTPEAKTGAAVMIEDGRIVEILGQGESDGPADQVIDLGGAYLLPGLWDVHVHPEHPFPPGSTVSQQTALFGQNLARGLTQAGVTGVRCGGAADFMDVAWRRAFSVPGAAGPRVFACGNFLTTTGGHFLTSGLARECDGPYGFAQAIREQMKNDVDHIKLNLSGGIMGPRWDRHTDSFLLPDELETVFALCHQRNFKVMAHATNTEAVKAAVRLGAHSVEHGYIMDEEAIGMLLDSGTWYVPTLSITHLTPSQATSQWEKAYAERKNLAPDLVVRAEAASEVHRQWFQQALAAGVKMALGSDINPIADSALLEMGLWVKAGATPWQTLTAATRNAAELCGAGDDLGTIEPGKLADLIVVADDPLADIQNLRRLLLVFKDGRVVADHR